MKIYLTLLLGVCLVGCALERPIGVDDQHEVLRLIDQGTLYLRSEDLENAEASFKVASEIMESAAVYDGLGCVALLKGYYHDAEGYFWRAYEIDSTYNNSLGNLALLYEITGRTAKAKELYARSLMEDPKNFRARNNYAGFLADKGGIADSKQAISELMKARMLAQHPLILDNIEQLQVEAKEGKL